MKCAGIVEAAEALRRGRDFLLSMHTNPDGDGIGSAIAMAAVARELGKTATTYSGDGVPAIYRFLAGAERVVTTLPRDKRWDATLVFDCGDLTRMGADFPSRDRAGVLVNLDHHITNTLFGDVNYIDDEAGAVGELVFEVARELCVPLSAEMADGIFVAIVTDTGSFRYSNTRPRTLRIAADCVAAGADPWRTAQRVFEDLPLAKMRLVALTLPTLEIHAGGKIAVLSITREMFRLSGATQDLTEGIVNFARAVEGVEAAALVRETPADGVCKVSFRSRGRVDVARVAIEFGGGGHAAASGATVNGVLGEVKARALAALTAAVAKATS